MTVSTVLLRERGVSPPQQTGLVTGASLWNGTETRMKVKEASRTAKDYLTDIFADEQITHVGLEEVEFNDASNTWKITIGFFRPWERPAGKRSGNCTRQFTGTRKALLQGRSHPGQRRSRYLHNGSLTGPSELSCKFPRSLPKMVKAFMLMYQPSRD